MQSVAKLISSNTSAVIRGILEWDNIPSAGPDDWWGTFISSGTIIVPGPYQVALIDGRKAQLMVHRAGTTVHIEGVGRPPAEAD